MSRLSIYSNKNNKTILHDDGFSFLAALALPLWLLQRRLYKTFAITLPALMLLNNKIEEILQQVDDKPMRILFAILWLIFISLICGKVAGQWHRAILEHNGYIRIATESDQPS
jgi:hypothetical protein